MWGRGGCDGGGEVVMEMGGCEGGRQVVRGEGRL